MVELVLPFAGKPGTWRETLSKDEAQQVDQLLIKLQGTGLEFNDD